MEGRNNVRLEERVMEIEVAMERENVGGRYNGGNVLQTVDASVENVLLDNTSISLFMLKICNVLGDI